MLKNKLFLLLILTFTALPQLKAQNFEGSLLLGVSGAQVRGDNMAGFDKATLMGGVGIAYKTGEDWWISGEFTFNRKGSASTFDEETQTYPGRWQDLRLSYIEIPLFFNYEFMDKLSIHAGFGVGILVGSSILQHGGQGSTEDWMDADEFFGTMDFTAQGGLQYRFTENIAIFSRVSHSFVNIGTGQAESVLSAPPGATVRAGMLNFLTTFGARYYFNQ